MSILCDLLNVFSEEFISNNNLYVAYGDLNCNWFKHNTLSDLFEIDGMVNLIEQPTCFKGDNPTLVNPTLANRPKCFSGVCNTDLGTSDFHNCICVSSKMFAPSHSKHQIIYRVMKHFSEIGFQNDVDSIPIAQIGPLSFQAAIEHKPRQVRWEGLHAPVVTEWWPACLHKQSPRVHQRGN